MINLLPKKEKKEIAKSLYCKLLLLFLVTMSVSIVITSVSILPSYFLSSAKDKISDLKLNAQKNEPVPVPDQQTLLTIKDLKNKISLVDNSEKNKFIVSSKVINAVIIKKTPNIKITDISYSNDPLVGKKVSIQGTAPSREVLLLFREALESDVNFKQVNLPISNFVKGSNIQFILSLIPA